MVATSVPSADDVTSQSLGGVAHNAVAAALRSGTTPHGWGARFASGAAMICLMRTWLTIGRDTFRTRLWPLPTIAVVVAVLLGLALPELDATVNAQGDAQANAVSGWFFGGDAEAARSLLDVIASSMITVTALTFSLTLVTLQLASSQYSPRLLRTFTRDQFVQITLALFLATFTYALTVLRGVHGTSGGGEIEFVPRISVSVAFLLALASVVGLVLFLAHLTGQIRVETLLKSVHADATLTMETVLARRDPDTPTAPARVPSPPADAVRLLVHEDGFLAWIDQGALIKVAEEEDALVRLDVHPGSFLVRGTPLGSAWPAKGGTFDQETADRLTKAITDCVHPGFERTSTQDVGYGLRQLTDVANKAVSPGINDPTTAVHALGHISAFLCDLTDRELGTVHLKGEGDTVRVWLQRPDLATYVDLGISQPRRYGASDPQVMLKIFQVLMDLSYRVAPDQRPVVWEQLARLRTTVAAQSFDSAELGVFEEFGRRVEQNLR